MCSSGCEGFVASFEEWWAKTARPICPTDMYTAMETRRHAYDRAKDAWRAGYEDGRKEGYEQAAKDYY